VSQTISQARFASRSLAEIAATLPGATSVFRRRKLDFCCGGKVSLIEAAAANNLPLDEIEAELGAIAALPIPAPTPPSTDELSDLIELRYHQVHRRELPELVRLAKRVEVAHAAHPATPRGIATLLETMNGELEAHMLKEEGILFPMMRRGGHPMIAQPIGVMLAEHDDHGEHLRELARITDQFAVPDDACPSWRALYVGVRKFADDLAEHIHTENNLLFPRFGG
jgi:regulator of cell morphogenesis and NO signaling